jgi:NADPH:quinone reductase-like Zn-dependent oxidoreductase
MQAIQLISHSFEHFQLVTLPKPEPAQGEVLIKVKAAALNALDLMVAEGIFPGMELPIVPVTDAAGEIAGVGEGVPELVLGNRVIVHFMPYWVDGPITQEKSQRMRGVTLPGSLAEYFTVPATGVVTTPDNLTDQEAATLPIAATTAWRAIRSAPTLPGSTVLLLGTGGVSLFALQYAKAAGATVLITSSSSEKLERAQRLGADYLINYRDKPHWAKTVMEITNGNGVDLVVETGGATTFEQSIEAVRRDGMIYVIGVLTGHELSVNAYAVIQKQITIKGNNTGSVADLNEATRALAANDLHPTIHRQFEWDHTGEAYQELAAGQCFGKVVLTLPQ